MKIKNKEVDQYLFKKIVNDKSLSRNQQARILGVSRQYLGYLIKELNLKRRINTQKKAVNKTKKELQRDYNKLGFYEQSKLYKVSVATLYSILKENKISLKKNKIMSNKLEFEKVASDKKLTRAKQAEILNISTSTLFKYLKEFGLSKRENRMKQDRLELEQAKIYKY